MEDSKPGRNKTHGVVIYGVFNMTEKEIVRYFGTAHGRVQGVGFRFFVQQTAMEHGLTGWVKNMPDGTVTMEIQGTTDNIESFLKKIRRGGGFIKVERLDLDAIETDLREQDFNVRY